jgi:outer membrane receptor protein involved in Fe transport
MVMTIAASAQDGHTVAGLVVDGSGAVIVGAEVTVTDRLGSSRRIVSDERGAFWVAGLPAGDYVVQVERKQFRPFAVTVHLGTGDAGNELRVVLRAAGVTENVTVIGRDSPYGEPETTTAGKVPVARRRVPNSVSVLTREQVNDQHMVNTWDALSQITGVTAISNDGTQSQFHARGAAFSHHLRASLDYPFPPRRRE